VEHEQRQCAVERTILEGQGAGIRLLNPSQAYLKFFYAAPVILSVGYPRMVTTRPLSRSE
jgi:hypothetical protein